MYTPFRLTALAIMVASTLPAAANDKLEEVVVTSSRIEMPLRQVGTSVSVITAEEIQALGFNSLSDVLRTQPSIGVSNNGGAGKPTTLRIRGEEGYRTLVLLDGINISDTSGTQSGPRMEHLLSSGIERVEILRGPQGLMYGADAGGVVNITTVAPTDGFGGEVSAEGGRYGTQQLAANVGMGGDSVDATLSVTDFETDGFNARSDDTVLRDDDGYENTTVHGRLGWNATDSLRLELVGRDVQGENEYDNCGFPRTDDCTDDFEQQSWRGAAKYAGDTLGHELAYTENNTERDFYSQDLPSYSSEGKLEKWSYLGNYNGGELLRLVYGVDLQTDSRTDSGVTDERDQDGYYLEYQASFSDQFFFTAGARHDDNEDFGDHTSWRTSGAYLIPVNGGEFKLRGTYGTGFRAPSLYEIGYNSGPWAYPPASTTDLDAEESEGFDLAVSWYGDDSLYLEAVYFDQTVSDEIYFDLANYSGYLQSDGDTDSSGVELIAEWSPVEALSLGGNYTYNDTKQSNGEQRFRRPKHLANIGANWHTLEERLSLGLYARFSQDAVDTNGEPTDDYEVVDITANFEVIPGLDIYARVENLFDKDYEEVRYYNTSGQAAYAGVRYSF